MKPGEILFLTRDDVIALGGRDIAFATNVIEAMFAAWVQGDVLQPVKTSLKFTDRVANELIGGVVNVLPAAIRVGDDATYGAKLLGAMPANVSQGVPRATGVTVLFDEAHKMPIAIMDAQVLSAMRTGAVSALAARKLCRQNTAEIGCIGAGVNMYTQLLGVLSVLPQVMRVKIYSRGESKQRLVAKLQRKFPQIEFMPVESARGAAQTADLIVTCVANTSEPVVQIRDVLRPGVTVFNIGCLENDPELLAHMDIIVSDFWEHTKHRGVQTHAVAYARGLIADEDVVNLGAILCGEQRGRVNDEQKIFFGPTGLGAEDIALGRAIYQRALKRGAGTKLTLWSGESWI